MPRKEETAAIYDLVKPVLRQEFLYELLPKLALSEAIRNDKA
jgi:hypothetical protein